MALPNLSILKTAKARAIRFSTLEAICEALECQPGDVLRFEAAGRAPGGGCDVDDAGSTVAPPLEVG